MLKYFCCAEERRQKVRDHASLNGIDYLEVYDQGYNSDSPDRLQQRMLYVRFLKPIAFDLLTTSNVVIEGGDRIREIVVTRVEIVDADTLSPSASPPIVESRVLAVEVSEPGDYTTYRLRLLQGAASDIAPDGIDPILSAVDFSFKVACGSGFDCQVENERAPERRNEPEISYLAKDFASFRQLMFDRMAVVAPDWQSRNPADLGVALVEILAYVGDYLSYRQDAIATEAYLRTARKRTSVRRHVRLVDYRMREGSNARVWVHLKVRDDIIGLKLPAADDGKTPTKFLTRISEKRAEEEPVIKIESASYNTALAAEPEVFEALEGATLRAVHNEMSFYTWDHSECRLPVGAVKATLKGSYPYLKKGDVLVFQEMIDPQTGKASDADPNHRHAVRLVEATVSHDPLWESDGYVAEGVEPAFPVTEIEWHTEDALPFPLCISSRKTIEAGKDVSVALGNIILADHGITLNVAFDPKANPDDRMLEAIPEVNPVLTKVALEPQCHCEDNDQPRTPLRYRPRLPKAPHAANIKNRPLTHAEPYKDPMKAEGADEPDYLPTSATAALRQTTEDILPVVTLGELGETDRWNPVRDLLSSNGQAREFVVEMENDGTAFLRFGDDIYGARPKAHPKQWRTLTPRYRAGNGVTGNIGADSLRHVASDLPDLVSDLVDPVITAVTNPLPATGGAEPESLEEARQNAPAAFRTQERAVTLDDYEARAHECDPHLQSAAVTSRWTGSWHTNFVTVDRLKGKEANSAYEVELRNCLEVYRMAGHDIEVDLPRDVALKVEMTVCVDPGYFRADVREALEERFSARTLSDGTQGVFHADKFSLGDPVFLSPLYEAAQAVEGVSSVNITTFRREDEPDSTNGLTDGKIKLERLEVARLDNDPSFPERGSFKLTLMGGK